jgi:hypothetical protein
MYSTIQPNRVTAQSPLEGVAVAKEVKSMFRNDLLSLKVPLKHVLIILKRRVGKKLGFGFNTYDLLINGGF